MIHNDWAPLKEVERMSSGLPMPENFYRAEHNGGKDNDGLYVHDQLSRLTLAQRSKAAEAYDNLYKGVDSRWECNTRLRQFADRCCSANSGKTIGPRRISV